MLGLRMLSSTHVIQTGQYLALGPLLPQDPQLNLVGPVVGRYPFAFFDNLVAVGPWLQDRG
eukprot:SAG31_NODE_7846_length_1583_cov_3.441375_3_plen_61_part_00